MESTVVNVKTTFRRIDDLWNPEKTLPVRFYLVTQIIFQTKNSPIKVLCESSMCPCSNLFRSRRICHLLIYSNDNPVQEDAQYSDKG